MSAVVITYPDALSDVVVAGALRRVAERLDPAPQRVHHIPKVSIDSSTAGHLAVCRICSWRSGPHNAREDAVSNARTHRSRCR